MFSNYHFSVASYSHNVRLKLNKLSMLASIPHAINKPVPGCIPTPSPVPTVLFLVRPLHVLPFWAGLTATSITFIHPLWAQINKGMQIQVADLLRECKSQLLCHPWCPEMNQAMLIWWRHTPSCFTNMY